jgi:hypothetical protein
MKGHPYKCDYCLSQKSPANSWWLRPRESDRFTLLLWDDVLADCAGFEHICSASCASKALSQWMARVSSQCAHAAPRVLSLV